MASTLFPHFLLNQNPAFPYLVLSHMVNNHITHSCTGKTSRACYVMFSWGWPLAPWSIITHISLTVCRAGLINWTIGEKGRFQWPWRPALVVSLHSVYLFIPKQTQKPDKWHIKPPPHVGRLLKMCETNTERKPSERFNFDLDAYSRTV